MPRASRVVEKGPPVSMDPRKDTRIWTEAIKNELAFQRKALNPQQVAATRGGSDKLSIQKLRDRLYDCSADYLWVAQATDKPIPPAPPPPVTSAMAELAMGVGDAETSFLRAKPDDSPRRVAHTQQFPTMAPWQMSHDIMYWEKDALDRWKAEQSQNVLKMPPSLPPVRYTPATISGPHAASVEAWRRSQVPLSQWELTERGDNMVTATKLSEKLAADRTKEQLGKLMSSALRVSGQCPSPTRAKWYER